MGLCDSNQKENRENEVKTGNSTIYSIDSNLFDVYPSICKIFYSNNRGSGFLIRLFMEDNEPLLALMTSEHIITEKMIEDKEEIEVFYNNQKKRIKIILNNDQRFIQSFKDMQIDCTVVEILPKDYINEDYFLVPNMDYNEENYKSLIDKEIYIVQFPNGVSGHSRGKIKEIVGYELYHKASTDYGSSGSPIFLIQSTQVIGIHKAGSERMKINYGDFIFPVLNKLKKIKKNNNNKIIINKKINELKIIIRPNGIHYSYLFGGDFISLNRDKLEIIVNGKRVLDLEKFYKDKSYFLKIKENNEIILKEIKTVTNMSNMFENSGYYEYISIDFENWDTSNVIDMKKMFFGSSLNEIKGISNWNTSKIRDMSYMFSKCENIPDISNWDTSNVNYMCYMFSGCNYINIMDISNWNTSNVKLMTGFFLIVFICHLYQIYQNGILLMWKISQKCLMNVNH